MNTVCYRIQHKETGLGFWSNVDKNGCFNTRNLKNYGDLVALHSKFPTIYEDFENEELSYFMRKGYVCGFSSKEVLVEFMAEFIEELLDLGFGLFKVTIDSASPYLSSYHQKFFDPKSSEFELIDNPLEFLKDDSCEKIGCTCFARCGKDILSEQYICRDTM